MRCLVLNDRLFAALWIFLAIILNEKNLERVSWKKKFEISRLNPAFGVLPLKLCVINSSVAPVEFREFIFEHEKREIELIRKLKISSDRAHYLAVATEYLKAADSGKLKEYHAFMLYCIERISFCFPMLESSMIRQKELRWKIFLELNQ